MEFYHGTTLGSARGIIENGFRPRGGAVWFTNHWNYAKNRAEHKARRKHDRPVVLQTELEPDELRIRLGPGKIHVRGGIIAINECLSIQPLQSNFFELLAYPAALAQWINSQLGLYSHNGVSRNHWGIVRLAHWMDNRMRSGTGRRIDWQEFFTKGKQWLPAFFDKMPFNPEVLPIQHLQNDTIAVRVLYPDTPEESLQPTKVDADYIKAIVDISDQSPKRRIRGLQFLEKIGTEELFDWCVLHLEDESVDVVCNALRIMQRCDDGYVAPLLPYARLKNKRIRAGALAALAKHDADDPERWFERGLKDPAACVRMEVARLLPLLDRIAYQALFDIARHDPNPAVKRSAKRRY
ncbi:MAG: HEAT repeat domain-containing protein [Candidatus Poribacteria bacterium]|nr:HEAT repeat domain-containing protein [Candidatus Poribacteria bacterium]